MASTWGLSFGTSWGVSWDRGVTPPVTPSTKVGGDDVPREEHWEIKRPKKPRKKVTFKRVEIEEVIEPIQPKLITQPAITSESLTPLLAQIEQMLLKDRLEQEAQAQQQAYLAQQAELLRQAQAEQEEEQEVLMILKTLMDEDLQIIKEFI